MVKFLNRDDGSRAGALDVGNTDESLNVVLVGQKIVSKVMDDSYIETCGNACAKKLREEVRKVSTGLEFINELEKATFKKELSACVFWGHSWNIGLYLQSDQGLYLDSIYDSYASLVGTPARKLSHLKSSSIKTKPHVLFIFASCGTNGPGSFDDNAFAAVFGNFIGNNNKEKDSLAYYKVTTIGATNLSNLLTDGTAKTDGQFVRVERKFKIEKIPVYKTIIEGWWIFATEKKVLDRWDKKIIPIDYKKTELGKKIDPAKIIKNHDSDDTSM